MASLYEMLEMMADAILGNAAYDVMKLSIQQMFGKNHLTKEEVIYALQMDASLMIQFNDISSKIENNFINSQILGSTVSITNNVTNQINPGGSLSDQKLMSEMMDAYKGCKKNFRAWKAARGNELQNIYALIAMATFAIFAMVIPLFLRFMDFSYSNNNGFVLTGIVTGGIIMGYFIIKIRPDITYGAKLYVDYYNKYETLRNQAILRGIIRPEDTV